jgi:hypothetical protein
LGRRPHLKQSKLGVVVCACSERRDPISKITKAKRAGGVAQKYLHAYRKVTRTPQRTSVYPLPRSANCQSFTSHTSRSRSLALFPPPHVAKWASNPKHLFLLNALAAPLDFTTPQSSCLAPLLLVLDTPSSGSSSGIGRVCPYASAATSQSTLACSPAIVQPSCPLLLLTV